MAFISICRILSLLLILNNAESAYELFSIGNNLELEGKIIQAIQYYEKVLEMAPETPEIYSTLANAFYKINKYDNGINTAKKGLILFPDDLTLLNSIAIGYIGKGDLSRAIEYYEKALIIAPDNIDIYNSLSILYQGVKNYAKARQILIQIPDSLKSVETYTSLASIAGKSGDHGLAIDYYRQAFKTDSTDITALIGIGTGFDMLNVKDSAIYYYQKSLIHDTLVLTVGKRLIDLYSDTDQYDALINMAGIVLKLDHYDGHVRRSLGYALYKKGVLNKALDEFLIASRLDPLDTYSRFYTGKIYLDQGDYRAAFQEIEQALEINPDFIELWVYLGFIAIDLKDFETADYAFTEAAFHNGDLVQIYYLLGVSAEMQQKNARAYYYYHKALDKDPNNLSALEALANLSDRINKKDIAFKTFSKIIDIDTTNATALNYVGYTYAEKNEHLEYAMELIDRALRIEPDNGFFIDSKAWIFYRMEEYNQALEQLLRAADIVKDAVIYEHLGDVYLKLGDKEKSLQAYEKALELRPSDLIIKKIQHIKSDNHNGL